MDNLQEAPLGDQFQHNPLQYMQNYVRNMNNELFLSEYHINNLYALLLIGRSSPWDALKPNNEEVKKSIDSIIERKVNEVKFVLENLSQLYEDKVKKNTLSQIERLMSIIRARDKSIFIQKVRQCSHSHHTREHQKQELQNKDQQQNKIIQQKIQASDKGKSGEISEIITSSEEKLNKQNKKELENSIAQQNAQPKSPLDVCITESHHHHHHQIEKEQQEQDQSEVFGLFYGLANLGKISALAMTSAFEFNPTQRYIKVKMGKNYMMTIKNNDAQAFDTHSMLSNVSSDLYVHHIFPYLTASQLFKARGVCKQWLQHVKQSWHSTFKKQMFIQLLACEFCKDIQFFYKLIQLRNPFFQKISLLLHALTEIIQWQTVCEAVNNNTVSLPLKRVLIILLKLIGQPIELRNINDITQALWQQHKIKILTLKLRVTEFFSNLAGNSDMSIDNLRTIKTTLLDNPFMRVQQMNSEDKTPLLLSIFIKQLTLQQILRSHIFFAQEYLLNSKKRLDVISAKMPQQRGFLEGVYKILLLKSMGSYADQEEQSKSQMPNFQQLLQSIFNNQVSNKPDFIIRNKGSATSIFMDKATKLDIIVQTVKKINVQEQASSSKQNSQQQIQTQENSDVNTKNKQSEKQEQQQNK